MTGRLVHVATIRDGAGGFTALDGPRNVATFRIGISTYAAITSLDGVQIADVTDPANPAAVASLRDSSTRELDGARDIEIFEMSSRTYAIVTGFTDDGVQIIELTDPRRPVAAGRIGYADLRGFDGPSGVAVFEAGGDLHAIVTTSNSNGVQIINIADPLNPAPAGRVQDNRHLELSGASGVDTFETGGGAYAVVVGYRDNGVQIINVTDPRAPTAAGSLADNADLELHHAFGVTTFESGGDVYAAVAGYEDYGIQVINVTDPLNPSPAGRVNARADGGEYSRVIHLALFEAGGGTYAVAAFYQFGNMHLVDLTDPYNPADIAHARPPGYSTGYGIDVFEAGGSLYAVSTTLARDDVYILRISTSVDLPPGLVPNPPLPAFVQAGSAYEDAGATCIDGVDGNLTGQIRTVSTVNSTLPGNYTVTYVCADSAGNEAVATRAVTVTGPVPATPPAGAPTIVIAGANPAEVAVGDAYTDAGAACTDDIDGDLTGAIRTTSYVNVHAHGNYTVTYACADSEGNEAVAIRTVAVTDADAPSIAPVGHSTVRIYVGDAYADAGATCIDGVEGDLSDYIAATGNIDTAAAGRYEVTYSCADSAGNGAVATRTVIVLDHVYTIADGVGNYTELDGASGVAVFERGGSTYAVVAASVDDGVQVIDVTDPDRPAAAGSVSESSKHHLYGVSGVAVFERGGGAYAIATAFHDDGIQVINVTDPDNPTAAGKQGYDASSLDGLSGVTVFEDGGRTYAIITQVFRDGIRIVDITNPSGPVLRQAIYDDGILRLDGASDAATFRAGGSTYAIVVAGGDDGAQIVPVAVTAAALTPPTITLNGTLPVRIEAGSTYEDAGAACADDVDGDLTDLVRAISTVDAAVPGNYTVTYTCTDSVGAAATAVREVVVEDTRPPTLLSADYVTDNGTLRMIFSEPLDSTVRWDRLHVRDTGGSSGGVTLDGVPDSVYGATLTATLVASKMAAVGNLTTPQLDIDQDAVADLFGNGIAAAPDQAITLHDRNLPPTVQAGLDRTVTGGQNATLSGTATDPDGDRLAYMWTHDSALDIALVNATSTSATFTAPEVSANTTLTFTLTATDAHNATASDSTAVTIAEAPEDPPAAPVQNITAVLEAPVPRDSRDIGRITLTSSAPGTILAAWEAPAESPANYRIAWAKEGEPFRTWTDRSGNAYPVEPTHTMTGLEEGVEYKVMVRASYAGTAGDWSGVLTIAVVGASPPAVPGAPQNLRATPTHDSVMLAWDRPDDDSITGYKVLSPDPTDPSHLSVLVARTNGTDTSYTVTGLQPSTAYVFGVAAVNEHGESGPSEPVSVSTAAPAHTHFVTTWRTSSANESIMIPVGGAAGTYTVDWGDGTVSANVTGNQRHTYGTPGTHTVRIYGDFTRIHLNEQQPNADRLRSIEQWGDVRWGSMNSAFQGASNMVYRAADAPDLSGVTDASWMFYGADSFNGNVSSWDVSAVTNMHQMFHGTPSFNQDLSSWDVSAVTDMAYMFFRSSSFNGDISTWNTSAVTDMNNMFGKATSFNQDLSSWDVSAVTDTAHMFSRSSSFNGNITTWNTSAVTDMRNMFSYASSFNQDISSWDVSAVTDMSGMFYNVVFFNQDISSWDVAAVTDMSRMFDGSTLFNRDISSWNTSAVTDMAHMFSRSTLFNQDISSWNTSAVTDMSWMFYNARSFNQDISGWDVSAVTDMSGMFGGATSFEQNLGPWYVTPATIHFDAAGSSLNITMVTAQNPVLRGHDPAYWIEAGGDSDLFEMVPGSATLAFKNIPTRNGTHTANVTASGDDVFESGLNHGVVTVTVTGAPAGPPEHAFVTTWTTTSANQAITLPVSGSGMAIHWGDGQTSSGVSGTATHTYENAGTYTVSVTGGLERFNLGSTPDTNAWMLASIEQWGNATWTTMEGAFRGASSMTYNAADAPDLSAVSSMHRMFSDTYFFNGDLSSWDVSAVTDMSDMFALAFSFDGDVSTWNVSAVTDMNRMFSGADLFDQDLSGWDVSAVTDMSGMFDGAASFDGDVSTWNVSRVTSMESMFAGADLFDGDITTWNTSAVTDMTDMFYDAFSFDQDVSGWDVSAATEMSGMFDGAYSFGQNLGPWYIVLDTDSPAVSADDRLAGNITVQNDHLSGHNPTYNVTGEHAGLFEVAGGALRLKDGQNVTVASYQVTVAATGDGLFGSGNRLVIPVAAAGPDVNVPPTVRAGAGQTVTGGDTVTLTGTAADPNNDRLAYLWSHDSSLNITLANTTSISTTFAAPEVSSNTTVTFTLTATDIHNATASDTVTVTVMPGMSVVEVTPALAEIHDQTVSELSPLTFTAGVTNGHLLAAPLVYGLEGAPRGASMNTATGEFEWTPTEVQNGGHTMTVTVSDQDGRTGSQDLVVMVREVNAAPVLDAISDQAVNASSTLTFTASATDGDRHPGVGTEVVANNLRIPWSIDWLPDGTALFTERGGKLRIIQDGILASSPLLSLDVSGGEGGLLGIAVDPDFGENRYIYLYYSTVGTDHAFINKVVRYQFDNGTVTEDMVLIDGIPGARYHDGGRIQFGPDGYLYVTTGDASVPALAQSLDSLAGKILRIDRDGGIPADNPFANSPVWSTGHRNSQGIDWDEHGNLVASEHGPSGGWYGEAHDEINVIVPGANYGWPVIVGGRSADGMTTPILHTGWVTWAPSGTEFYHGEMIPGWTGKYFVAALKGAHLHMVDLDIQNDTVVSHQRLFQDEFGRLRDVQTGPDGYLYLLTSNRDGRGNPVSSDDRIIRVVLSDDADRSRPANTLTYGLEGAPEGASIDPASGAFTWEPTDSRQSGTTTFNVTVSDGSGGTDAQPVRVHVIKAPDAPQNLRAAPTHNSVILTWDHPDDDSITGYKILSGSAADQLPLSTLVNNTNSTDAFYAVENLEPSTAYVFGVVAINEHGESGPSGPVSVSTAPPARTHFVTIWETTEANEDITIPVGGATGRYTVDWGDGTVSANVTGDQMHAYGAPGTHTVRIYGDFARMYLDGQQPNADRLRSIEQWGDIRWESMSSAFRGASNMGYNATDAPDLSAVSSMHRMFSDTYFFNGDLSGWDTSAVANMSGMFFSAFSFDGDLSGWDTSAVTDMSGMFGGAFSFDQDLSAWNVSGVTDMNRMFSGADLFDQDLSGWDVSAVTDMSGMFDGAASFDGDVSTWNVSRVTSMESMFAGADLFDGDITTWNTSAVTDMTDMFYDAFSFDQDVSGWDVSGVAEMSGMLDGADLFEQNLGPWYIVLDTDSPAVSADDRLAGNVTAQNAHLAGHSPTYNVTGEHAGLFEVAGGALRLKDGQNVTTATYQVTVAATGDGLFGSGNHLVIPVDATGPDTNTPPAAPQNLRFGAATNMTVTLTWDDPDNAAITGYKILSRTPATQAQLAVLVNNTGSAETAYTVRNLEPETAYVFRVVAVNDHGESGWSNFVRLSTAPTNAPPTVQAGPDRTIPEGDTVTLTGTATDDDGTDTLTYLWTHDSALDIALVNATSISTTFTAPEVSSNTTVAFTLTATDAHNATASDRVEITIAQVNAPPAVQAGPDRTIPEGDTVTLTGTATDPDGDRLAYLWTHDSTLEIAFANSTAPSTTFTAPRVTSNTTITLTLSADDGTDTSSDTLALTVTDTSSASDTSPPSSAFVTTWRTSTAGESITIPVGGAAGTYTVNWGDGTISADVTGDQTHTYGAAGTYSVSISGDFARIHLNGDANAAKLRSIDQWGDTQWESMEFAFKGASHMAYRATDSPDLSDVTSMRYMFHGASSFDGDISSWDVSSVTNMLGTFQEAASFNGDISSWDVSAANDMRYMFGEAASFNGDISSWDVSAAIAMTGMFHGASSFNQDISDWDVSAVTDMRHMFHGASSFNQDLSSWDVSAVTTMVDMFRDAASFNQDISDWDVSSVTNTAGMFYRATAFNGDISTWDVSAAADMDRMFHQAGSFAQNLGRWYITLDDTTISSANETLAISAQNAYLDGQSPTYSVDDARFAMAGGALAVNPDQTPQPGSYNVTIDSAGGFGTGNSRVVEIAVDLEQAVRSTETVAPTANHTGRDVPDNRPPTADAGPDRTVNEGSTVVLNGTAADPDDDALTYLWTSEQPGLSISGSDTLSASFTAPQVSSNTTITFTLTATDTHNATATDSLTVTVTDVPPPNRPPTADAGPDRTVNEGSTVVLNGTAADPDDDALTYLWTSEQPGLSISGSDTLSASFTAPQVSSNTTITFTLTATDTHNATATDQVRVTVTDVPPPGSPPAAPQNLQATSTLTTITLTWDSANDDSITGYKILSRTPATQTELSVLVDDTGSAGTSYVVRDLDPDTVYVFRVVAVNEHGESDWSNFVRPSTLP